MTDASIPPILWEPVEDIERKYGAKLDRMRGDWRDPAPMHMRQTTTNIELF